jgi:hypothetical protein
MQLAGSSSWRFEADNAQFLHLALFTRDAAGILLPQAARLREIAERRSQVFDPPDFESLQTAPALRTAAVATFAAGLEWSNRPKRTDPRAPSRGSFAWPTVRSAAESVAAERGVPTGDLAAVVHVLDVQGQWSFLAGSGCALCSTTVPTNPAMASLLLREVFGSGAP